MSLTDGLQVAHLLVISIRVITWAWRGLTAAMLLNITEGLGFVRIRWNALKDEGHN
jgi:hypothetical protein